MSPARADYGVLFGTFDDHDLFTTGTVKLLVELTRPHLSDNLLEATVAILRKCGSLVEVTLRCDNLTKDEGKAFRQKVEVAVNEMKQTMNHNINVQVEREEDFKAEIKARNKAQKKRVDAALRKLKLKAVP